MATTEPNDPSRAELDVRSFPPKDRYDAIMHAYETLTPGATLDLTVDHDPTCMYYTLKVTRGDDEDAAIADEGTRDLEDTRWMPIQPADSPMDAVSGAGRTAPRRTRSLAPAEIDAVLRRNYWGILATAADRRPYAVPVVYGYDGSALYVATGPGRKLTNLLENPNVCVTIAEVEDAASWRSVVVAGEARPLEDLGERLAAFNILRRQ